MIVPHAPWLVALSVAIAIQGSFVGLSLARELEFAEGFRRRLTLAGASLTLATGVWSMHFVGMLAATFPSAIDYFVLPTLISFLICVIVVGIGVFMAHADGSRIVRIGGGAVAMGLGISLMHYVGMSAVHLAGPTRQEAPYVVASVAVSIGVSALALWALDIRPTRTRTLLARAGSRIGDFGDALHRHGGNAPRSALLRRFAFRRRRLSAVEKHSGVADDAGCFWRVRRLPAFPRAGSLR